MIKFMRIAKSVGIFLVILIILPFIAIKSGLNKLFGTRSLSDGHNKIHELDKLAGGLSNIAHADVVLPGGGSCSSCSSCGCGHDSGGY